MDENSIGDYQLGDSLTSNDNLYSDCEVFEARHRTTQKQVIIKLARDVDNANREMEILNVLSHEFIVKLLESFQTENLRNVMVFERYPRDLQDVYTTESLESNRIQKFMRQLITGLEYIHGKNIIHRDIKPENILVDGNDTLKIGDFGLSRYADSNVIMTPEIITLWYRPIEVLLECSNHTTAVDIWSAGCVFAELYRRYPLFKGESQINMLNKIIKVLGKPTTEEWPTMNDLPIMQSIELDGSNLKRYEDAIPNVSEMSIDLIKNMIKYDPEQRFSASQILQSDYFQNEDTSERNRSRDPPDFP
ncbi:hypothetical protein GCK72_000989 [Caenorhabditis remanei]|uniref:Protein kinase domain-containing protein n=1 Tax=Caenorhabditis remanei TaxID=31234 RepID=E3LYA7_CAERE|nr:hypothetical protein GCK72_000989 [Caenorhabditis remanei]EFO84762.1 hypothetical protein CRE_03789 [Caenorhabditis remanei]KAF1769175.1 hypothetical protein GCK72_000989 [Caenorhabditis remanei]